MTNTNDKYIEISFFEPAPPEPNADTSSPGVSKPKWGEAELSMITEIMKGFESSDSVELTIGVNGNNVTLTSFVMTDITDITGAGTTRKFKILVPK